MGTRLWWDARKGVAQPLVAGDAIECGSSRAGATGGVSVLSFVFLRPVMQKALAIDDATLDANANNPTNNNGNDHDRTGPNKPGETIAIADS